jgi:hypothetical protein
MISGEVGSWVRKHTGTADAETKDTIDTYIANAHMYYTQLCSDKAFMETVTLNRRKQSQLLGVLFAEYEILTTEQASMVRDQMKKPYHVFANSDSLWAFYNYITNALQFSHPKTWMEDQRILHYFIGTICDFSAPPQPVSTPVNNLSAPVEEEEIVDPLYADPGQTNILDQIAEQDAFSMAQLAGVKAPEDVVQEEVIYAEDLHQSEEIIEDVVEDTEVPFDIDEDDDAVLDALLTPCAAHDAETVREIEEEKSEDIFPQDEIVQYTDPVGNTFEAPVVIDTIDLNNNTKASVILVENAEDTDLDFDLDFNETEADADDAPDFF